MNQEPGHVQWTNLYHCRQPWGVANAQDDDYTELATFRLFYSAPEAGDGLNAWLIKGLANTASDLVSNRIELSL